MNGACPYSLGPLSELNGVLFRSSILITEMDAATVLDVFYDPSPPWGGREGGQKSFFKYVG